MPTITYQDPKTKQFYALKIDASTKELRHPATHEVIGQINGFEHIFDACPVCGCKQFFLSKDFNQMIGCGIMLMSIILVPLTYGISLPVFAAIDWLLYKKFKTIINCYRCSAEFRDFTTDRNFKPFMHHIGLKYDKYR